jgi:hypothetical protein
MEPELPVALEILTEQGNLVRTSINEEGRTRFQLVFIVERINYSVVMWTTPGEEVWTIHVNEIGVNARYPQMLEHEVAIPMS